MCGERVTARLHQRITAGSSPRVRGTRPPPNAQPQATRFIPACAGNAPTTSISRCRQSVHPRVCGERAQKCSGNVRVFGSSPRVRGTPGRSQRLTTWSRFIPACAGNAISIPARPAGPPVHPRVCGEREHRQRISYADAGSSPRVRGTPSSASRRGRRGRFIPACAGNARPRRRVPCGRPVHPRVCGERGAGANKQRAIAGSSPRVRGTPGRPGRHDLGRRFIPACAGNASSGCRGGTDRTVHPRVCGERRGVLDNVSDTAGSSPRVRGTLRSPDEGRGFPRFIPACAGNACGGGGGSRRPPVHPRVCGEREGVTPEMRPFDGSSPRVRGTLSLAFLDVAPDRFIPACAGNAVDARYTGRLATVHPRVCGERVITMSQRSDTNGSSPRVRGTLPPAAAARPPHRFIPACAGNAQSRRASRLGATVHPRVCGEREDQPPTVRMYAGSSPRVRGTPRIPRWPAGWPRFIPACAGNAIDIRSTRTRSSVHPRVCGERELTQYVDAQMSGSSPRVRGTRERAAWGMGHQRFIPACAGNAMVTPVAPARPSVHPRVCGERRVARTHSATAAGSSPRVRGTLPGGRGRRRQHRFIPACAGNAACSFEAPARRPVHPRVCGERWQLVPRGVRGNGSSPRVRGTRCQGRRGRPSRRFIPACAGNASNPIPPEARKTVHPRVCGERPGGAGGLARPAGSSPRVRGTPWGRGRPRRCRRFIPACAGNALASRVGPAL